MAMPLFSKLSNKKLLQAFFAAVSDILYKRDQGLKCIFEGDGKLLFFIRLL